MKVICINNKPLSGHRNMDIELLTEGNTYTVIDIIENRGRDVGYKLIEAKTKNPLGYSEKRFIPLSSIDETEFKREYNTITA